MIMCEEFSVGDFSRGLRKRYQIRIWRVLYLVGLVTSKFSPFSIFVLSFQILSFFYFCSEIFLAYELFKQPKFDVIPRKKKQKQNQNKQTNLKGK